MKTLTNTLVCFFVVLFIINTNGKQVSGQTKGSKIKIQIKDDSNGKILVLGQDEEEKKGVVKDTTKKEEKKKNNQSFSSGSGGGSGVYLSRSVLQARVDSCLLELGNKDAIISYKDEMISGYITKNDSLKENLKTIRESFDSLSRGVNNGVGKSGFSLWLPWILLIGLCIGFLVYYKKRKPIPSDQRILELEEENNKLKTTNEELKKDIATQDAKTDELNKQLEEKTNELKNLNQDTK